MPNIVWKNILFFKFKYRRIVNEIVDDYWITAAKPYSIYLPDKFY